MVARVAEVEGSKDCSGGRNRVSPGNRGLLAPPQKSQREACPTPFDFSVVSVLLCPCWLKYKKIFLRTSPRLRVPRSRTGDACTPTCDCWWLGGWSPANASHQVRLHCAEGRAGRGRRTAGPGAGDPQLSQAASLGIAGTSFLLRIFPLSSPSPHHSLPPPTSSLGPQ